MPPAIRSSTPRLDSVAPSPWNQPGAALPSNPPPVGSSRYVPSSMPPCEFDRRNEILDQPIERGEDIRLLAPADMPMVAFASFVVEADNALAADDVDSTIFVSCVHG